MAESDEEKRREALKRLRSSREAPEPTPGPLAGGQGGLRGRLGQGGGGLGGGGLRARLGQGGGGGGLGGGGGGLRARLGQGGGGQGGAAGGPGGGGLRARLGQGGGGLGGGAGGGLRARLGQGGGLGGGQANGGGAAAGGPGPNADPAAQRAFLAERIEKMQARLAEIDAAAKNATVEDAKIIEESGPGAKPKG